MLLLKISRIYNQIVYKVALSIRNVSSIEITVETRKFRPWISRIFTKSDRYLISFEHSNNTESFV